METIFENITALLVSAGSAILGYLSGRKRYNKEVESVVIDNVQKAVKIYQETLDDLQNRFDKRIGQLEQELKECKEKYLKQ